jgi:ABC-type sugar transport system ATPase subunit
MRQEIANLHRRLGTAMVFVTHDQIEAMTLADRIVVMNQQRIEQVGSPLEIYRNPASIFVATFVGSPAMNILPAGDLRLGIRPESVRVTPPGAGFAPAEIEFVEFLGDKTHIHLALATGDRLVAQGEATFAGREHDVVGVSFDRAAVHLFASDGRRCSTSTVAQSEALAGYGVSS